MKKLLLISIFALLSQWTFAQIEVIEIDTLTNTPNKPLPFDKPFVLKMYVTDDVIGVSYLKQYGRRTMAETIKDRIKEDSLNNVKQFERVNGRPPTLSDSITGSFSDIIPLSNKSITNKKVGDKKLAFVYFSYPELLKPNTNYFIIVGYGSLHSNANDFFRHFYLYTKNNNLDDLKKAKASFLKFKQEHRKIFGGLNFLIPNDFYFEKYKNVEEFKKTLKAKAGNAKSVFELYEEYDRYSANIITSLSTNTTGTTNLTPKWTDLNTALNTLKTDIALTDTMPNNKTFDYLSRDGFKVINAMVDAQHFVFNDLLRGKSVLNCVGCDTLTSDINSKTDIRAGNLSSTIALLKDIRRSVSILNTAHTTEKFTVLNNLKTIIDTMSVLNNAYKQLFKLENTIREVIPTRNLGGFRFFSPIVLNGSSHILNLETRSKNLITPDFGMAFPNIVRQNTNYGLLPYVGFHINFAPIDRDAIFSKYKKSVAQRFSLSIGYSLVSIKDSTAKGQKFNFFEKSSFLTGIGFRLGNLVRVLGGYQWYFEVPASTVALEKKLKGYPFLGLSIDLSVKSLLNGLGDILPGISKTRETIKPVNIAQP